VPASPNPLPRESAARQELAARLAKKETLAPADIRLLRSLGSEATLALALRVRERFEDADLLTAIAVPSQTALMTTLWLHLGRNPENFRTRNVYLELKRWLARHADDRLRTPLVLAAFTHAGTGPDLRNDCLRLICLSQRPEAVRLAMDALRGKLAGLEYQRTAYLHAAGSSDANILAEIRRMRARSHTNRFGVAPAKATEDQRILQTAFEARFHFEPRATRNGWMQFPRNKTPFPLSGWRGRLQAASPPSEEVGPGLDPGIPSRPFIRFEPPMNDPAGGQYEMMQPGPLIRFAGDRKEAMVAVAVIYGALDAISYDIRLRRIRGEWYVVGAEATWMS